MGIWDFIVYFSASVCYIAAATVIVGWVKYARGK